MGHVYRAHDPRLGRDVALKVLPPEFSIDPERKQRFEDEARAIAALNHPYICAIYDVGRDAGITYLVMEYVEGQTLRQRLKGTPVPLHELLTIAIDITEALSEAHQHGIIHRDLKPGNIMLARNGAKLLDFGLATTLPTLHRATADQPAPGRAFGTPAYMSPEQVVDGQIDPRSDVFSLGIVLYEMATGTRPFSGSTVAETMDAVLHHQPEAVTARNRDAPPELERVTHKCLEKEREHRYQSARELRTALWSLNRASKSKEKRRSGHARHNLPAYLTSFVGREREIEDLKRLLTEDRLLTLTGSAGCGKTRLCVRIASEVVRGFSGGVWLTELAPVSDPELVPQAVARAVGVQEEAGRSLLQQLVDFVDAKQLLLVLDNCEHLTAACATLVETLLKSSTGLRVLVTSREPLRVSGERVWQVPPLSFPDAARDVRLPEAARYEAVRLFVERAQCVCSFDLDEPNVAKVAEICQRLDGIPLALEMAAARLNVISLDQIANRLEDRFRLLSRSVPTPLRRQYTLQATIDWSYNLLSPTERTLFERLAVFAGNFSLEAAEAVCSDSHLKSEDILDELSRLVDKSLVTVERSDLGVRYRVLETIREYALRKLRERGDELRAKTEHCNFFVNLAEALEPELFNSQSARLYGRLELEHQNFVAALRWCNAPEGSAVAGMRLAGALLSFWDTRGYGYCGPVKQMLLEVLQKDHGNAPGAVRAKALDAAGYFVAFEDLERARLLHTESLQLSTDLHHEEGVGRALWRLGSIAWSQGHYSRARALQEQGVQVNRRCGNKHGVANCLNHLGILAFENCDYEAAHASWKETLQIFRELNYEKGLAVSLSNNARLALNVGDFSKAEVLYSESLALSRRIGDKKSIARELHDCGLLYCDNDYPRARALFEESLAISRTLGLKPGMAYTLTQLSGLACCQGRYQEARGLLNESLFLYEQLDRAQSANAGVCLRSLGEVAFEAGQYDNALELCQRSVDLFRRPTLAEPRTSPWPATAGRFTTGLQISLCLMGWIRLARGERAAACAAFEESLSLARESSRIAGPAEPHLGIGFLELLEGNCPEANSHFEKALVSFEKRRNRTGMVRAFSACGDASFVGGHYDAATELYERALRLAVELGFKKGLACTLRSLGTVAGRQGRLEVAARSYGACDALLQLIEGKLTGFQSIGYELVLPSIRSELGDEQFERFWREGGSLPNSLGLSIGVTGSETLTF
jgi:non-specific serine/threonine protein kinase